MIVNAGDFRVEQRNPRVQFVNRIGGKILCRELARGIATGARTIILFHACAISQVSTVAVNGLARYCDESDVCATVVG